MAATLGSEGTEAGLQAGSLCITPLSCAFVLSVARGRTGPHTCSPNGLLAGTRRALRAGQQADVQVAPAHQPREVAADHQHRADVAEQVAEV
jgi:hypothetical protein